MGFFFFFLSPSLFFPFSTVCLHRGKVMCCLARDGTKALREANQETDPFLFPPSFLAAFST